MDADLMSASGAEVDAEQSVLREAAFDEVFGPGGAALAGFGGEAGAMDGVASDGFFDDAVILFDEALDEGEIDLFDVAVSELMGERVVGLVGFGDDEDAAGEAVEAMDDARAERSLDLRELREVMEQGVDEGSVMDTGSSMDGHAGRLVDDDDVGVFVDDVERDVFGSGGQGRQVSGVDVDHVGGAEELRGFGGLLIDEDATVFGPGLQAGTRDSGELPLQEMIETLTGGFRIDGEVMGHPVYAVRVA